MIQLLKKILERLFGYKWICEHCARIEYATEQPFCKHCCHIHRGNVKMFKIKK